MLKLLTHLGAITVCGVVSYCMWAIIPHYVSDHQVLGYSVMVGMITIGIYTVLYHIIEGES